MPRWSLAGRLAAALAVVAGLAAAVAAVATRWLQPFPATLLGLAAALPFALWIARLLPRRSVQVLQALHDGIVSLRDRDFSISVGAVEDAELAPLVGAYNSLGDLLRRERLDLYQRELLLDTVVQTTPLVLVLTNSAGRIVYSNIAARQLLREGRKLEGFELDRLLDA